MLLLIDYSSYLRDGKRFCKNVGWECVKQVCNAGIGEFNGWGMGKLSSELSAFFVVIISISLFKMLFLLPPIKGGSIVERAPVQGSNFVRSYTKSQPHRKSSLPYPDFWQFELS